MLPIYLQIANHMKKTLASNIGNGIYKLPTEASLCSQYQASRQTIRQALSLLAKEGLIEKRQGSGSYTTGLLHTSGQNDIAIMLPTSEEYIYPALYYDIQSFFSEKHFNLKRYETQNLLAKEREILLYLIEHPVRALIAEGVKTALPNPNLDLYQELQAIGTVVLFFKNVYPSLQAVSVKEDNIYGAYSLTKYLLVKNHSRIAGCFLQDSQSGLERYEGFLSAIRESHLPFYEQHIGWFSSSDLKELECKQDTGFLSSFIKKELRQCSAVICHNDEIAYWLIKELHYASIRVPEDISVVSFDNSYLSDLSDIRITSLTHKSHELGMVTAETLYKKIQGTVTSSITIPWTLAEKSSVTIHP